MNNTKKEIKVWFTDFWGYEDQQFNSLNNYFVNLLSFFNVNFCLDESNPDILFYSCFGSEHKKYQAVKKIYVLGENSGPRFRDPTYENCDLTLSHIEHDKNVLFPLWLIYLNWFSQSQPLNGPCNPSYLINLEDIKTASISPDKPFCCMMNNNPVENRVEVFRELNRSIGVHSLGDLYRNQAKRIPPGEMNKIKEIGKYNFVIAMENSYHPNYTTEKFIHVVATEAVPIFWGGFKTLEGIGFEERAIFLDRDFKVGEVLEQIVDFVASPKMFDPKNVQKRIIERYGIERYGRKLLEKILE